MVVTAGSYEAKAAQPLLDDAQALLQRVVCLIEREPDEEVGQAAREVERALRCLYDVMDRRADSPQAFSDLLAAIDGARGSLGEGPGAIEQARATLDQIRMALGQATAPLQADPWPPNREVFASGELPRLHRLTRPSLGPKLRVAPPEARVITAFEPLPPASSHEQLETYGARQREHIEAHLTQVFAAAQADAHAQGGAEEAVASAEAPFISKWARECFDEVAMLGGQRQPMLGDDWRRTREIEDRLLWTLDAFASLGPRALQAVESLVLEAPAPDPELAFAAGLLLGSFEGRDALGLAERIARAQAADSAALQRFGDALMVAPHRDIETMLRSWLAESDPGFRVVAARVLASRRRLTEAELSDCAGDRAEIAAQVLVPMALDGHPELDQHLRVALDSRRRRLRLAGWQTLTLTSRRNAAAQLQLQLDSELGDQAAILLAGVGSRDDGSLLTQRALGAPTVEALEAVALCGHVGAIEGVLELLRHDDQDIALAAARTLERITGAGLLAEVEIDADKLDPPELPEPDTGGFGGSPALPPRQRVSSSRLMPAEGSPDLLQLPAPDYDLWSRWWQEHREQFSAERRYRTGQLFTPLVVHAELNGPQLTIAERRNVGRELLLLGKEDVGFDVGAFVVVQEQALDRWGPKLQALGGTPGAWPR